MRSVLVSDWNGKSLSMSFTSSLEIDPKIQQAKDLSDFYHSLSSHEDFKSLTTNGSSTMKPQSSDFVTLKQIHDEFADTSTNPTSKYYNTCAYLTGKNNNNIRFDALKDTPHYNIIVATKNKCIIDNRVDSKMTKLN